MLASTLSFNYPLTAPSKADDRPGRKSFLSYLSRLIDPSCQAGPEQIKDCLWHVTAALIYFILIFNGDHYSRDLPSVGSPLLPFPDLSDLSPGEHRRLSGRWTFSDHGTTSKKRIRCRETDKLVLAIGGAATLSRTSPVTDMTSTYRKAGMGVSGWAAYIGTL